MAGFVMTDMEINSVSVGDPVVADDGEHLVYPVRVNYDERPDGDHRVWNRRFRRFEALHKELKPLLGADLPAFVPKPLLGGFGGSLSPTKVAARRQKLDRYLQNAFAAAWPVPAARRVLLEEFLEEGGHHAEHLPSQLSVDDSQPAFNDNIILMTDSYKLSHYKQYPPGSQVVYSYFESRGGVWDEIVFFGLQYFLQRYLEGVVVTRERIEQASRMVQQHMGGEECFHRAGWEYILEKHGGKLPIAIKAVPEGTVVPVKNVLFTMENTDPACYWLTNYLETLLVQVWYPMTVCTNSWVQKAIIQRWLAATGTANGEGDDRAAGDTSFDAGTFAASASAFKLHDFGFRGVSSVESAALGGAAHLVNFCGTDTMAGYVMARKFYDEPMAGFSIPAAEHSTMTSWTREREADAYRNMLTQFPTGLVAVVSDSYDIINACENIWGKELKELVEARDGTLVVRPDSGDPPTIVVQVLEALGGAFGTTLTGTRHRLLPPCVRVIQGDGIDAAMLEKVLEAMAGAGWAADNLAFGSGGALLQKLNRDTQKCAFKCSEITVDGAAVPVYKDPVTDKGKKSKKGRLTLERGADGTLTTVTDGKGEADKDQLVEVFRDGALTQRWTLADVRGRALRAAPRYRDGDVTRFSRLLRRGLQVMKRPIGKDASSPRPKSNRKLSRVLFCDEQRQSLMLAKLLDAPTDKVVPLAKAEFVTEHGDGPEWLNVRCDGKAVFHISFASTSTRDRVMEALNKLQEQLHLPDAHAPPADVLARAAATAAPVAPEPEPAAAPPAPAPAPTPGTVGNPTIHVFLRVPKEKEAEMDAFWREHEEWMRGS
eukprot:g1253.t1